MKRCIGLAVVLGLSTVVVGQDYVGQETCALCHSDDGFYDGYVQSGHPWKLVHTAGEVPPPDLWPWTPLPPLPTALGIPLEWADVEYVIGNYYWKARFVDRDGYIHTGNADETTQWNLATQEFVPYHAGEIDKPYNCGKCHTTGFDPAGSQGGLPGMIGTFAAPGVQCEACHGPGSEHFASGGSILPPGGKTCAECHFRDADFRMPWSGGFMRHHQQAEDLSHSAHSSSLSCTSCHNPHKSVVYDLGGTTTHCTDCHEGTFDNGYFEIESMPSVDCKDCHMPFMGKSAVAFNEFKGDIRGHLFQIMTDPVAAADNVYDVDGKLFWNQDGDGDGYVTLDYSCLGCHTEIGLPITLEAASAYAQDIHETHRANPADVDDDGLIGFQDLLLLLSNWGPCPADCPEDVNRDGIVNFGDLLLVLSNWD